MQLLKADYDYCTFDAKKLSLLRLGIFFFFAFFCLDLNSEALCKTPTITMT